MTSAGETTYDVVVVGARVAGASTAMLLARAGAHVALVDRAVYGSDTVSTHGLMRAGVLQLHRWGLLDRIVTAGTPPVRRTTFHYDGTRGETNVQISIRPSGGIDALYAPRRHVIDRVLVDAAAEAGVDVLHETRVDDVVFADDGRVCGVAVHTPDGRRVLRSRYVVGADGIGSLVARAVRAETVLEGRGASAVRYAYYSGLEPTGYEWAYADGAAAGIIPTNDDVSCVFVSTTPLRMRTLRTNAPSSTLLDRLFALAAPAHVERLAAATRVGKVRGWGGVPGFVRNSWGPGWALVGDAGYFMDPLNAHGMSEALRDAELLSSAVLESISGARPESAALEDYQRRRDALSAQLFAASDELATYEWNGRLVQPLLRRLSASMTDEVELLESLPAAPVVPRSASRLADGRALSG